MLRGDGEEEIVIAVLIKSMLVVLWLCCASLFISGLLVSSHREGVKSEIAGISYRRGLIKAIRNFEYFLHHSRSDTFLRRILAFNATLVILILCITEDAACFIPLKTRRFYFFFSFEILRLDKIQKSC